MVQPMTEAMAATIDDEALQALYARNTYLLRESRKALFEQYGVETDNVLLEKIKSGEVNAHPAYEHYLSALIVEQLRQQMRAEMAAQFNDAGDAVPSLSVHLMLKNKLAAQYAEHLSEPVRLAQDALLLSFNSGLMMEVRYFSSTEYAINWSWGDAELRIDTAPVHPECATFPQHLHDHEGKVRADPITQPGADCWINFSRVLNMLLENPLLDPVDRLPLSLD